MTTTTTRYVVTEGTNAYSRPCWQVTDTTVPADHYRNRLHQFAQWEHATFAAEIMNGLPEGYSVTRDHYPARGMKQGSYWKVSDGTRKGWSRTWDEGSPTMLRPQDYLISAAVQHAAGAPARAAAAAEQAEKDAAAAARKQYLADLARVHGPRATVKQVDYILRLLASRARLGEGGGFMTGPTTREGIEEMSSVDASAYIDSLRGNY